MKILISLFAIVVLCAHVDVNLACDTDPDVYHQLVHFYNQTGGPHWYTNWDVADKNYCSWHGIYCNTCYQWTTYEGTQKCTKYCYDVFLNRTCNNICNQIEAIELPSNNLTGSIPDLFFEKMTYLTYIHLGQNYELSGIITEQSFANTTRLNAIFLYSTIIIGDLVFPIDKQCMVSTVQVNELIVVHNVFQCNQIYTLSATKIKEITNSCKLHQMNYLSLIGAHLDETIISIPHCICSMTNLTQLNLGFNNYSGPVRECLGDLKLLTQLEMNNNKITNIEVNPYSYQNLIVINMAHNKLSDDINSFSLYFPKISTAIFSGNNLKSSYFYMLGASFGNNIQNLYLDNNPRLIGNIYNTLFDQNGDTYMYVADKIDIRGNPLVKLVTNNSNADTWLFRESGNYAFDAQSKMYCPILAYSDIHSPRSSTTSYFELVVSSSFFVESSISCISNGH